MADQQKHTYLYKGCGDQYEVGIQLHLFLPTLGKQDVHAGMPTSISYIPHFPCMCAFWYVIPTLTMWLAMMKLINHSLCLHSVGIDNFWCECQIWVHHICAPSFPEAKFVSHVRHQCDCLLHPHWEMGEWEHIPKLQWVQCNAWRIITLSLKPIAVTYAWLI